MSFDRVLIAVDDGPTAAHTASVGASLGQRLGAELGLIHVVDPATTYVGDVGIPAGESVAGAERIARGFLERLIASMQLPSAVVPFVVVGHPKEAIVRAARDWPADLLVIGMHTKSRLVDALLGSVAQTVVHRSSCPVVVVRRPL